MTRVGKKTIIILAVIAGALAMCLILLAVTTRADDSVVAAAGTQLIQNADTSLKSTKAIAAAIAIAVVAAAGAISMAIAIRKSTESIARQPEAESGIRSALMIGLVFIETAIIYALIVAILIIFVL